MSAVLKPRLVSALTPLDSYPIAKDMPIPKRQSRGESKKRITMRKMAVGDSFLCHNIDRIYQYARELDMKVTCRNEGSAWRVWRTA